MCELFDIDYFTDLNLAYKVVELDKRCKGNRDFFKLLKEWINDKGINRERKLIHKKINKYYINSHTTATSFRELLVKRCYHVSKDNKTRRNRYLVTTYNITETHYDLLLKNQEHKCKICKIDKNNKLKYFAVDHCHESGKVRGLLCNQCNVMLGMAKDTIATLKGAIRYLKDNSIVE